MTEATPEAPEVVAPEVVAEAPPAVPTLQQQPSSAPAPEPVAETEEVEPLSLEDAARDLLTYVKAHRTAGDSDLEAAVAAVEAALALQA
jgi:hypothetical protein